MATAETLITILQKQQREMLEEWFEELSNMGGRRDDLVSADEIKQHMQDFMGRLSAALSGGALDPNSNAWEPVRDQLAAMSRTRARQGFSPRETALIVFSLKRTVFNRLRTAVGKDPAELADAIWETSVLFDSLGLFTVEATLRSREEIIARQQQELLELSTPVVELWDGILALPMIGTLDSARTQIVMESLLQRIVETGSTIAILDITGVPTVDTLVAQHLLKTVAAARLMGAECIISGIRPQIAQTIVHLGVDLSDVITKGTLADAFRVALSKTRTQIGERR
ncbi:MAG TPA: STAS domain-containing protein [Thermoanaerobaculia bacterium]